MSLSDAERQKRYRDKQRNAQVTEFGENVTRVTASVTPEVEGALRLEGSATMPLMTVLLGTCYNRPAVACDEFGTRPGPLSPTDQPVPHNRGRYKRLDGTVYQFDTTGRCFECKHPFTDRHGNPHLAVYETATDVRQATGACL